MHRNNIPDLPCEVIFSCIWRFAADTIAIHSPMINGDNNHFALFLVSAFLEAWPKITINWAAKLPPSCENLPPSITEF